MRLCACGYSCGTEFALARHLERLLTQSCSEVPPAEVPDEVSDKPADPSVRLRTAAVAGDHVLLSQLLMDGAIMQTAAPLEAAVRNGHTEATSVLLRHCRTARLKRPLDAANGVANVLYWAASGSCSLRGPAIVTMLVRDKHIELLRKGPLDSWQRLSLLLGKPGTSTEDNDDSFTESGRAAIAVAQSAAVPPAHHSTWASAKARRPGAAKLAAQELVAEQVALIALDLDRRGWDPSLHRRYSPRFREVVLTLLLGSRTTDSVLALLGEDLLLHLFRVLAHRVYWELENE